jgi:hypothetical protein
MVWFFTRSDERLSIETRIDSATYEYVLQAAWPGRPVTEERFPDAAAFDVRVRALERELDAEQWQLAEGQILPPPWHGPTTH